jgi:hypothetical protein
MAGTAEYQVGLQTSSHSGNLSDEKPAVQTTLPPEARVARTGDIRPVIWLIGIIFRQQSVSVRHKDLTI